MFDVFQGLFLEGSTVLQTAIFLAGCAILIVMGLSFEKAFSKVMAGRTVFPIILTILLAQIFFSHTVLSLLVFQSPEQVKLAEGEIITLMIASFGCAALTFLLNGQRRFKLVRYCSGSIMAAVYIVIAVVATFMALPAGNMSVNFLPLAISIVGVIGACGAILWYLIANGGVRSAIAGMALLTLAFTIFQMTLAASITISPDEYSMLSHTGKGELWLEIFLAVLSVMALALCAVMGNNPRQHWRRYAVTALLVSIMSVSIFIANEMSLRYSNAHFELSRLIESLNAQRSSLYVKSLQFYKDSDAATLSQKVSSDVFTGMQTYFDTSIQIDELIRNVGVEQSIRDAYTSRTFELEYEGQDTLKSEIHDFYNYLKSTFGLQSSFTDFSEIEQIAFERRLNAFSNLIISKARNASDIQIMIKEMVLIGGFFIITFLIFGVFLPAHKSTINALDALEAEKARIYKLALCAEHTTKGIVLTNGRGQITWCNDAFCDMTGYRFGELEGKTLLQATRNPEADQSELDRVFGEVRGMRPTDIEVLARRKDNSDFWMNGSITPIIANGSVRQVVHVLNDVTEEREMRDRLSEAQAESDRLALVARYASDGIAIIGADYDVKWINQSFEHLSGYSLFDLQRNSMIRLLSGPGSIKDDLSELIVSLKSREPHTGEFFCYRADGSTYWIEAHHTPLFDDEGRFNGYIVVHRDITERKQLQLELISSRDDLAVRVEERTQTIMNQSLELEKALAAERELNKMQTEFVSMASHEFRTPLTIIDGVARRLEKRAERWSPDDIREKAQSIRTTVKRMTMLVERTLDASRLSSGRIKLTPETFGLRELATEVCQRQRDLAPSHKIDVDLENFPETLFGDARLMDNVFTNIISNAVKYSGESKYVKVTGTEEGDYAVLKVRDHGVGIPKTELPKIFQRFFRASTSTGIPGTGIGLNLVKSLVDMHYGTVELDSVEGEWTEFTVRLPLESPLETGVLLDSSEREGASDDYSSVA
ncbi:MAG: hypothetical protein CMK09_05085 [Ponticaulis sp.]|nr:hypothetical protein [Ponticaulis sp.]|tara:strand:+ start:12550 stop:15534 length:2985 start_codon:yes stop_codon:yes gene_type:complete